MMTYAILTTLIKMSSYRTSLGMSYVSNALILAAISREMKWYLSGSDFMWITKYRQNYVPMKKTRKYVTISL